MTRSKDNVVEKTWKKTKKFNNDEQQRRATEVTSRVERDCSTEGEPHFPKSQFSQFLHDSFQLRLLNFPVGPTRTGSASCISTRIQIHLSLIGWGIQPAAFNRDALGCACKVPGGWGVKDRIFTCRLCPFLIVMQWHARTERPQKGPWDHVTRHNNQQLRMMSFLFFRNFLIYC